MSSSRALAAAFGAALFIVACSPSAPQPVAPAAPAPAPAAARPAQTIEAIHHALLIPGSEVLYSVESAPPDIAAAWTSVKDSAAKVAQGADQLAFGRPDGSDPWTTLSHQLGAAARASAAASDVAQLRTANEALAAACSGCHQAYVKPGP